MPLLPGRGTDAKLAARVADRIIEDVIALGWPVGRVLGSEGDLLERYGVSRAVYREAVRLVEHRQVARTRRGPGGGLLVIEPGVGAVIDAVVLYLHRVDAPLDEVFEAKVLLEEISCDLACARLEEADLLRLRGFLEKSPTSLEPDPRALHSIIASCSHNPAIVLFVEVLNRVALLYSTDWERFGMERDALHAHARIAEAVIAGDSATARRRMRTHLQAEFAYLRRRRSTRRLLPRSAPADHSGTGKMAEYVARSIAGSVIASDLRTGDLIGTEPELIELSQVSRAVFREAVRLLEYHRIARMRRGPGGGLFVVEPSAAAVTDVAAIYLARRGMEVRQLSDMRTALEVSLVGLAVERLDGPGRVRIDEALEREAAGDVEDRLEALHDLHAAVASASGNRVLELVALVLIRLSRLRQAEKRPEKTLERIRAEVSRTHAGIARAVLEGDREMARHRMHKHLEAVASKLR